MLSALWGLLGLIAIITLFIIYANLPSIINVDFLKSDLTQELDRNHFFFMFCGLYLAVNLIIYLAIRAANNLSKVYQTIHREQHLKMTIAVKVLACGANLFIITLMIYSRSAIVAQSLAGAGSLHWILLLTGPLVMVSGLLYLLFVLMYPHHKADTLH